MADQNESSTGLIRLNKFLSECGITSRRKADELINEGAVTINGKRVYELGTRVDPKHDKVSVNGKPVRQVNQKVYIMFHKPRNMVTTMEDPQGRPTIADFFQKLPYRVFPVGRLDWDTEGLILLTNDGDFSQRVMHPNEEVPKTYLAKVSGKPTDEQLRKLLTGVSIVGGRVKALHVERIKRGGELYDWIKIVIGEGKNRQVRRMFEKIGFDVMKLQRVAIGRLRIGTLDRGEYAYLTPAGVAKIFQKEPLPEKKARSDKANARPSKRGGPTSSKKRMTKRDFRNERHKS